MDGFADFIFHDIIRLDSRCSQLVEEYKEARLNRPNYDERLRALSNLHVLHSFRARSSSHRCIVCYAPQVFLAS